MDNVLWCSSASFHRLSDLIRMDRIKVRQQKFKRGKEKMLCLAQESADGQTHVRPEEEDDDDGMMKPAPASPYGACNEAKMMLMILQCNHSNLQKNSLPSDF